MTPAHTRKGGKLYRYYVSTDVLKRDAEACPVRRIPAAEIESAVIDQLREMLRAPEIIVGTSRAARQSFEGLNEAPVHTPCMWCHHLPDDHVFTCTERYCTRCVCLYYASAKPRRSVNRFCRQIAIDRQIAAQIKIGTAPAASGSCRFRLPATVESSWRFLLGGPRSTTSGKRNRTVARAAH